MSTNFHRLIQKGSVEEAGIKTITSPQIFAALRCKQLSVESTMQLYTTGNSVQVMQTHLITVNVYEECYFFLRLYRLIYHVFKMFAFNTYEHYK